MARARIGMGACPAGGRPVKRRIAVLVLAWTVVFGLAGCDPQNTPCDHEGDRMSQSADGHIHHYTCRRTSEHGDLEWRKD
jgi:hypothetical protein